MDDSKVPGVRFPENEEIGELKESGPAFPKDGGPAFPKVDATYSPAHGECYEYIGGMSLLDWLAGKALEGLLSARWRSTMDDSSIIELSSTSYKIAHAMLKEKEK